MTALFSILKLCCLLWILTTDCLCTTEHGGVMEFAVDTIDSFKLKLHQKLEMDRILRNHDMHDEGDPKLLPIISTWKVQLPVDFEKLVKIWFPFIINDKESVFAVTRDNVVIYFEDFNNASSYIFPLQEIYALQAFQDGATVWLVTLCQNERGHHFLQLYEQVHLTPVPRQVKQLSGSSLMAIVQIKMKTYLILLFNAKTLCILELLLWTGTRFELVTNELFDKRGSVLRAWSMNMKLFIAISFDDKSMTKILLYNSAKGNFSSIQYLENCHVIQHFEVLENHYLICGTEKASLYWWNNSKFSRLQEFTSNSKPLRDASFYSLSAESVILVLAWKDQIEFYFQDSSSQYVKSGVINFEEYEILRSLKVWRKSPVAFILPIFDQMQQTVVFEVHTGFNSLIQNNELRTVQNCTSFVDMRLNMNQKHIDTFSSKTDKIWIAKKHISVPSLFVNGSVLSKNVISEKISIPDAGLRLNALSDYESLSLHFKKMVTAMQRLLTTFVLKTGNQKLKSNINFTTLVKTRETKIKILLKEVILNEVKSSVIPTCLKTGGQQQLSSKVSVGSLWVRSMQAISINEKQIENLVVLNKSAIVKGYFILGQTIVKDAFISGTLNNLSIPELVLLSKTQAVNGTKTFPGFAADHILAKNINGVNVSNLKTAHLAEEKFDQTLTFTSELVIRNANVTMKEFNFPFFLANVVTKNKDETMKAPKFMNTFSVKNSLTVAGLINEMDIAHLMMKYIPQNISGNFTFKNVSFQEIETNYVNNLDLSKVSVRNSSTNTIKGKIKFSESLYVSNILLKENVLLDYVDPAKEAYNMKKCCDLILNASVQIGNIQVKGNATIAVELFPFLHLLDKVWLKSVPQKISYGKFRNISLVQVKVKFLNGIKIMNIIPVNGDAVVNSTKWFNHTVSVNQMMVAKEKRLSHFLELDDQKMLQVVGHVNMPHMLILGNLSIFSQLNNITVSDVMTVQGKQVCNTNRTFQAVKAIDLKSTNISFEFYNKADLKKIFKNSVVQSSAGIISNKKFESLNGEGLNVTGFLGGKNCTNYFQNFVTLNSFQEIPANHSFKTLTAESLHARNLDNVLKMVVCKNKTRTVIANKTFQKGLFTKIMNVSGKINQINVTVLQANAFLKDNNNSLKMKIKFLSKMKIKKLQIQKYSTLDDTVLDTCILIHGNNTLDALNASSLDVENITINGCRSACCLKSVFENAVYLPVDSQKLSVFKNIKSLVIKGELLFSKGLLNDLLNDNSLRRSDLYRNFVFGDIQSKNIKVLDGINDIDLDFIFKDSTNYKMLQPILGKKVFFNLAPTNVSITELLVETVFNKPAEKVFGHNKDFKNATFVSWKKITHLEAKNVTIKGTVNRIKLPEDVVLVEDDQVIYSDVLMNATMNMTSGIDIYGWMNGVKLESFLKERVTLHAKENISSAVTFENNTFVNGHLEMMVINNISLSDVLRNEEEKNLTGVKKFQRLHFHANLIVKKYLNDFNLSSLVSSIANISGTETFDKIIFDALNVTNLSNTSMNGVSADVICSQMHDVDSAAADFLNELTQKINNVTEDFSLQKEVSEYQFTMFEFFTLYQVLKPHHTQKFLPAFEPGTFGEEWERRTSQMVVWAEKPKLACGNILSYVMDVMPNGTLAFKKKLKGRVYPFSLQMQLEEITGFWIHMEQNSCRTKLKGSKEWKKTKLIVNTVYSSDVQQNQIIIPSNASVLDMKLFEDEEIYLMVFFESEVLDEKVYIYEYEPVNNSWSLKQTFHSDIPSSHDLTSEDGARFPFHLAIISQSPNSSVSVYAWVEKKFELFIQHSKPTISAVLWVRTEKELLLMLARANTTLSKGSKRGPTSLEALEVFAVGDDLVLDHSVSIHSTHSLKMFNLDGEIFVLACSRNLQVIYILQLRGQNGFQIIQEISTPGVTGVVVFTAENDDVMLAVSSSSGHTRILKAVIMGDRFPDD